MQADWLFWMVATALALGVLGVVFAPLVRGAARPERRASYDMQVFRDQLREIDADVARGVLTPAEAGAVRVEISRRLLGAADAEAVETASADAPRGLTRTATVGIALMFALGAGGLYATLGAPGLPDQPRAERLADLAEARANRPSQAEGEAVAKAAGPAATEPTSDDLALIARLKAVLAQRPDDVEGHRLLARASAAMERWAEARAAQERVLDLLGPAAAAQDHVDLAEIMVIAAGGYVSPQAEGQLSRALELSAENPVARYYSGLALYQGGRPDLTFQLWSRLLAEGPADAPWITPIASQTDEIAALAGRDPPPAPSRADIEASSEADRAAMISGMVEGLSDRLAAEGGPPEDWVQLIRSLGVLGRVDEAAAIFREAREVFAADPEALALLRDTAADAGVVE